MTESDERLIQAWKSKAEAAERTVASLACLLGWGNVPPQEVLERSLNALNGRVREQAAEIRNVVAKLEAAEARCVELERELVELRRCVEVIRADERSIVEPKARAEARQEALEEAAQVAESHRGITVYDKLPAQIRALMAESGKGEK